MFTGLSGIDATHLQTGVHNFLLNPTAIVIFGLPLGATVFFYLLQMVLGGLISFVGMNNGGHGKSVVAVDSRAGHRDILVDDDQAAEHYLEEAGYEENEDGDWARVQNGQLEVAHVMSWQDDLKKHRG